MQLTRLDDYQSWLLTLRGHRVAVDPWLTHSHKLLPGHWLFGRSREHIATPKEQIADVDAFIITGPFADHCDEETLSVLPRKTPAYAKSQAARRLRGMGFTDVTTLRHGEAIELFDGVMLEGVQPGFPYRHNSIGFTVDDGEARLYFETHVVDVKRNLARTRDVDVAVLPVQGVWLFGVPFVMSPERALEVTRALGPKRVVPTGNDPHVTHGLMSKAMLSTRGSLEDFGRLLKVSGLSTAYSNLRPGETLAL